MPTKRGAIRFFTFSNAFPLKVVWTSFPALKVLRDYNTGKLKRDFLAGINVALLAFPQGMAYAMIAGLPIEYGLYGSAIALIVGMLFAGSHFVVLGPTNATSVLLLSTFSTVGMVTLVEKASIVPTLLLLVGLFLILGALLRTASLIQYVSKTVVTGYIMAAASLIIVNQVQSLLGFQFGEGREQFPFLMSCA